MTDGLMLCSHSDGMSIPLRLEDLRKFNDAIKDGWREWIQNAPPDYTDDGFFLTRKPISISSRYGQNQRIGVEVNRFTQKALWSKERDYSQIRYVSFALATHIRLVLPVMLGEANLTEFMMKTVYLKSTNGVNVPEQT